MKLQEQFVIDVPKDEVLARSDAILSAYGYARQPGLGSILYTRGHPNKILYSFMPRSFGCEVEIWPVSQGASTEVDLRFKLHNFGYYPLPQAISEFLRDEFSDFVSHIRDGEEPVFDRVDQERRSSRLFFVLIAAVVLLTYPPVIILLPSLQMINQGAVLLAAPLFVMLGVLIAVGLPIKVRKRRMANPILPLRTGLEPHADSRLSKEAEVVR